MRKYQKSNYAINKYKKGIVYHFQDGSTTEVSLEDYLKENPERNQADFLALKELSDQIYYEQVLEENRYERRKSSIGKIEETEQMSIPSMHIAFAEKENRIHIQQAAKELLLRGKLTEV